MEVNERTKEERFTLSLSHCNQSFNPLALSKNPMQFLDILKYLISGKGNNQQTNKKRTMWYFNFFKFPNSKGSMIPGMLSFGI